MRVVVFAILFIAGTVVYGQASAEVSLTEYISEIQIWEKEDNTMTLSFWIPQSYWGIVLKDNQDIPKEAITQVEEVFGNYVLICALDIDIHEGGTMSYTKKQDLRESLSIEDSLGKVYKSLADDQLSPEVLSFSELIKPMFAQMFGQLGEGMHFYFFEVKDKEGNNVINEYNPGSFTVKHSGREFKYSLPLVTLLPAKECPADGAEMRGNWNYCPIHGDKLE